MNIGTIINEAAQEIQNQPFSSAYKNQLAAMAASGLLMAAGHTKMAVAYNFLGAVPMMAQFKDQLAEMSDGQKIGLAAGAVAGVAANLYLTKYKTYRTMWKVGSALSGVALVLLETTEAGQKLCSQVDATMEQAKAMMANLHNMTEEAAEPPMAQ